MPDVRAPELSIGQVAERTGLSVHALRFYEREGILTNPIRRGGNGRRIYTEQDLDWLAMCIRLRASGIRRIAGATLSGMGGPRLAAWPGRARLVARNPTRIVFDLR